MIERLALMIEKLPEDEGIFCFVDEYKQTLYVGIGKNIKAEVQKIISEKAFPFNLESIHNITLTSFCDENPVKLFAEIIRKRKPLFNLLISEQKLYPHLKVTREEFPRLLVTRKIENDEADYFGAFLPETGVRFLLDFLARTFRLRSCMIPIDGNFPVPCTQFYEKLCVAPCVKNICSKSRYNEFVELVKLFLQNKKEDLNARIHQKIETAAQILDFETATFWRDILLNVQEVWKEKNLKLFLEDTVDTYEIAEKNSEIFIYLVTQRGRKILGKRVFVFEKKHYVSLKEDFSQFLWQFYQFHAPKEIRVSTEFPQREFLGEILSRREKRNIKIMVIKSGSEKVTTERAFGRSKFEFDFKQIKPIVATKDLQKQLKKDFKLKNVPKRIECFDVAHISATNFVAAKAVWSNGEFLASDYNYWVFDESSELKMLEKAIEKSFKVERNLPDLVLIDGGKPQLKAALAALENFGQRKFSLLAAVKPPQKHDEISHFINEKGEVFAMKADSDAMLLLLRLRDEAHELANRIHRIQRDTSHFYELSNLLPELDEKERYNLLQKFGSIKKLKQIAEKDFAEMFGEKSGAKIFAAINRPNNDNLSTIKAMIVPIRYDDPNGGAKDLRPLRLRRNKNL